MTRREFISKAFNMTCLSAVSVSMPIFIASTSSLAQANTRRFKALVYIFLAGGNDSFNMISPKGNGPLRTRYEDQRRKIAHPANQLNELNLAQSAKIFNNESYDAFGMHPACVDLANMFNGGEMGVICNMGNLVEPTTRQDYLNDSVVLPPRLFSHADQQRQFQSEPSGQFQYGWGGRVSEMLMSQNLDPDLSPLISVAGLNPYQVSQSSILNNLAISNNGEIRLAGNVGKRRDMLSSYMSSYSEHLMSQKYQDVFNSAQTSNEVLANIFAIAESNGVDYDGIFTVNGAQETSIGLQLKTVAKMISGRASYANNRPIFFVKMDGFDTHKNILEDHQQLMQDLNNALKAFRDVLQQQGDWDKVLSFAGSEFGRTFTPNGNDVDAGTDHGWGGHALVMGGMVNGARFFGTHPDLVIGKGLDVDSRNARGRWIPTTSTSQCSAVIADWFGVPRDNLTSIFPSLANFPSPFQAQENLNFLQNEGA